MTFAHLPAGFITCTLLYDVYKHRIRSYKTYLFWGLLGSVLPDFDFAYLFLFDEAGTNHHVYITHYPIFWAVLLIASAFWLHFDRKSQLPVSAFLFTLGGFIHMFLDTVSGRMYWFAPFSYSVLSGDNMLFSIAPDYAQSHRHWGYGVELLIIFWAAYLYHRNVNSEVSEVSALKKDT